MEEQAQVVSDKTNSKAANSLDALVQKHEIENVRVGKPLFEIIEDERMEQLPIYNSLLKEEDKIPLKRRTATTILEMGDLAVATKVFNHHILKGLRYFLKANGYDTEINQVVIAGGLKPAFPLYSSVRNRELLKFIGCDPERTDFGEGIKDLLDILEQDPKLKKHAEEHWVGKITTMNEAEALITRYVVPLLKALPNARVDYFHSDEDKFNLEMKEKMERRRQEKEKKKEYAVKRGEYKLIDVELKKAVSEHSKLESILEKETQFKAALEKIYGGLSTCKNPEAREEFLKEFKRNPVNISSAPTGRKNELHHITGEFAKTPNVALRLVSEAKRASDSRMKEYETNLKDVETRVETLREKLEEMEPEIEELSESADTKPFTWLDDGQMQDSLTADVSFTATKEEYNSRYYDICKDIPNFHVHTSKCAKIGVTLKGSLLGLVEEGKEDKDYEVEADVEDMELEVEAGGKKLLMTVVHNMNITNLAGMNDLEKITLANAFLARVEAFYKGRFGKVPDIFITEHGAGGFRHAALTKYKEKVYEVGSEEEAPIPEICMAIKLPCLEDLQKTSELADKIKVPATDRFNKHMNASGVVLHTILGDESHLLEYADSDYFKEIGKKVSRLETMDPSDEAYKSLKAELDKLVNINKERVIPPDPKEYEGLLDKLILGDIHFGGPNMPGRPTNYEFWDFMENYFMQCYKFTRLKSAALSEICNGDLGEKVQSAYQENGDVPSYFEDKQSKFFTRKWAEISASALSPGEKEAAHKALSEYIQFRAEHEYQMKSINSYSLQKKEAMKRMLYLFDGVLNNQGELIFISGNHPNKTQAGIDEAEDFKGLCMGRQLELDPLIKVIRGQGSGLGGSGSLTDKFGVETYYCHVPPKNCGKDPIAAMMKKALRCSESAQEVIAYHLHKPTGGFENGTAYTMASGVQTISLYTDIGGLMANPRGFIMKYRLQGAGNRYHAWHYVLSPTLQRYYDKRPKMPKIELAKPSDAPVVAAQSSQPA